MSAGPDDGLRKILTQYLKPRGFTLYPIETGATVSGVPDTHWMHVGRRASGWIECKKTNGWALEFRPHQLSWLEVATACGVPAIVAVRARGAGSGGPARDALWLLHGSYSRELEVRGLRCAPEAVLLRCSGPPRSWDWDAAERVLIT